MEQVVAGDALLLDDGDAIAQQQGKLFFSSLHQFGFAVISIPTTSDGALFALPKITRKFFIQDVEVKNVQKMDLTPFDNSNANETTPQEEGYVRLFDYEFYQVRKLLTASIETEPLDFRHAWWKAFTELYSIGGKLLQAIDKEREESIPLVSLLDEDMPSTSEERRASSSLLRSIHYFNKPDRAEEDSIVFPEHTDIGLLTIIPLLPSTFPGLQIFNQQTQEWCPIEELYCPRYEEGKEAMEEEDKMLLLVFGGETLQQATDGFITAAKHRVVMPPSSSRSPLGRISVQLFLRANPKAKINTIQDRKQMYTVQEWEKEWESLHDNY